MMRQVTILTLGSEGDVRPYVALGLGLRAAGCRVKLATDESFAPLVRDRGLDFAPLDASYVRLADRSVGGARSFGLLRRVLPLLRRVLDDCWAAAQGAEVIVYHPKTLAGRHLAEKLGVPGHLAHPAPLFSPTGAFPSPLLPPSWQLGSRLNRLSYVVFNRLLTLPYAGVVNRWRRETLGLPPLSRLADLALPLGRGKVLYCYSRHVLPAPPDWDKRTVVTGYWFLDEPGWEPPQSLEAFLAAGPPPVYVGFGSLPGRGPRETVALAREALARAGRRGVIANGGGGVVAAAGTIYQVGHVPHGWLFPRMAAAVHHGGAGTTGEGLRASLPTVVCPLFGDQPFWGWRVHDLGAGPRPLPQSRLTADSLARAIVVATEEQRMRERARTLGERLRAEDGVARAVRIVMSDG